MAEVKTLEPQGGQPFLEPHTDVTFATLPCRNIHLVPTATAHGFPRGFPWSLLLLRADPLINRGWSVTPHATSRRGLPSSQSKIFGRGTATLTSIAANRSRVCYLGLSSLASYNASCPHSTQAVLPLLATFPNHTSCWRAFPKTADASALSGRAPLICSICTLYISPHCRMT